MERIEKLKSFLQGNPFDSFLQHALALEYMKQGNPYEARLLFESILQRDTGYIGSYYHLGKLLEGMEEKDLAMEWYKKGIDAARAASDQHACNELQAALEHLLD